MKVVVEADGGSRGNPGPAGYGAVVYAADGAVLAERSESVGTATNNVAEYGGLIAGLAAARDLGATEVAVRMDSKLVVEQMKGNWQVKNAGLRDLAREAMALRGSFESVSFEWIPRERNKRADALANQAMDRAQGIPRRAKRQPSGAAGRPDGDTDSDPDGGAPAAGDVAALAAAVRNRALLRGEFTLRSGAVSDHYFDKYRVAAEPPLLRQAAAAMAGLLPEETALLAGLELGGVPLAAALSLHTGHGVRFVRKQAKSYGTRAQVEGGPVDGRDVVPVEDVVTSGGALLDAVTALRDLGATVQTAVCLVDRREGARAALAARGVDLRAALTANDLE